MPTAEIIDAGFSTADAGYPTIGYASGDLSLTFLDWREKRIRVVFRDVIRFEWNEEPDSYFEGEPSDGTCILHDSSWVPTIAASKWKHYRLNFNACGGRLDIACASFSVEE